MTKKEIKAAAKAVDRYWKKRKMLKRLRPPKRKGKKDGT